MVKCVFLIKHDNGKSGRQSNFQETNVGIKSQVHPLDFRLVAVVTYTIK